jgi:hypothetical protein
LNLKVAKQRRSESKPFGFVQNIGLDRTISSSFDRVRYNRKVTNSSSQEDFDSDAVRLMVGRST